MHQRQLHLDNQLITLSIAKLMLIIGVIASAIFSFYQFMSGQEERSAVTAVMALSYSAILLTLYPRPHLLSRMLTLSVCTTCIGMLAMMLHYPSQTYWLGVIPIISFSLLGTRKGLYWSLTFLALFISVFIADQQQDQPLYNNALFADMLGSFILIIIFTYLLIKKLRTKSLVFSNMPKIYSQPQHSKRNPRNTYKSLCRI